MRNSAILKKICVSAMILLGSGVLQSCSSIFEYEGDCSSNWRVDFRYDMNIKYADAFGHEAKAVTLYAFDSDGVLVWQKTEHGDTLATDDYAMTLDLAPGTYDLVAWSTCDKAIDCFAFPKAEEGKTTKPDLICEMNRQRDEDGKAFSSRYLGSLMHGCIENLEITEVEGTHTVRMPMVKNTNDVRIILQHLSGETVDHDVFTFSITDQNGILSHDNTLLPCEEINYRPWRKETISTSTGTRAITEVGALIAELTLNRLMAGSDTKLEVFNDKEETVLSIPLVNYALMIKGHYDVMDDQEYLDRQDEYNMTFFLDDDMQWVSSYILINSWKVVLNDVDFD
jgi:hypothetical protein